VTPRARAALAKIVQGIEELLEADGAAAVYSQTSLPPGAVSRGAYLERHRQRVRAGIAGWSCSGQVRTVTAEAWEADLARQTARTRAPKSAAPPPAANDVESEMDRRLGITLRGHR
jgi:hypothetical protein